MTDYPMHFDATSESPAGISTPWTTLNREGRKVDCAIPHEFKGPDTGYSPEDLFVTSLMNCYIATFKVIAQNSRMTYSSISGSARLVLDNDETGNPWMIEADLSFRVAGAPESDRVLRLMERVSKQCMIINSVKTKVRFHFDVVDDSNKS